MIFDHIIVGAGAAGSVLANRLTESGRSNVLLLEAGRDIQADRPPSDIRSIFPLSSFNEGYMWPDMMVHWDTCESSPQRFLPQGRVVGGSTALMGMWAVRGQPADYDEWEAGGARGWGWDGVLPFFRKLESDIDFDGPLHGQDGPIQIRRQSCEEWTPFAQALDQVARRLGWRRIGDSNAEFDDGHCVAPISRTDSRRSAAGLDYLTTVVRRRPNLHVVADTTVTRLILENGRAVGVEAAMNGGDLQRHEAGNTIVTAGALRTPALLMRSGLGPAEHLTSSGIQPVKDMRGVGANLQNHWMLLILALLKSSAVEARGERPIGTSYFRWTSSVADVPGDMNMYGRPYLTWHALAGRIVTMIPILMRPFSRGRVSLGGRPDSKPLIEFCLSDERDVARLKEGVRLAIDLLGNPEIQAITTESQYPGDIASLMRFNKPSRVNGFRAWSAAALLSLVPPLGHFALSRVADLSPARLLLDDEDAMSEYVRDNVFGASHVCGTCRIGDAADPLAVVDTHGRVHGVDGLMVADASVMPSIPGGNTHIPTIMVAEKIAAGLTN